MNNNNIPNELITAIEKSIAYEMQYMDSDQHTINVCDEVQVGNRLFNFDLDVYIETTYEPETLYTPESYTDEIADFSGWIDELQADEEAPNFEKPIDGMWVDTKNLTLRV